MSKLSGVLDVAIIGGGPAGTVAAIEARRRGLRVAIWEKTRFPRDKVCGEFISAEVLPFLQSVIPGVVSRGFAIRRAEFIPSAGTVRGFDFTRSALGLSRRALDAALWQAAIEAGAEAREEQSVTELRRTPGAGQDTDIWEIKSATGETRQAKALIIACGRWWNIDGFHSPTRQENRAGERWLGVKAHFAGVTPRGCVEMYLFKEGYCGLAPVEDGSYNLCCLLREECAREAGGRDLRNANAWPKNIFGHPALEARLREAQQLAAAVTTFPVFLARRSAAQNGALLAGDASGFLDPFTGEGISMALHSGRLAADAVAKRLCEGWKFERTAELYTQHLSQAVRGSYKFATAIRNLLGAHRYVQSLAGALLPCFGRSLLNGTRWRESTGA